MTTPRHPHRRPHRYVLVCDMGNGCDYRLEGRDLERTVGEWAERHLTQRHDTTVALEGHALRFRLVDTWTGRVVPDELARKMLH
jgi:hypothetical protein